MMCACVLQSHGIMGTHSRPQKLRSIWPAPWIEISGRLQSVLVTDWSDAKTIRKTLNRKRNFIMKHGGKDTNRANFCCNVRLPYLQRKYYEQNHPFDLFGEKAIKEGIGWDLETFSRVKISLDAGFPSRVCRTCYLKVTKFQELVKMVLYSKAQQESIIRSKRGKTVQESPSFTTSPGVGREKKKEQGQLVGTYVTQNLFY